MSAQSRAGGPRAPVLAGGGAGPWAAVLIGLGLAALAWLAWLSARVAAALSGGRVPAFGGQWVLSLARGRTAAAWPGTPTVLVVAVGILLAAAAAAAAAAAWRGKAQIRTGRLQVARKLLHQDPSPRVAR